MVNEGAALRAEKACLSEIPQLKANWRYTSEVSSKFVAFGSGLSPYPELEQDAYKVQRSWRVEDRDLDPDKLVAANLTGAFESVQDMSSQVHAINDAICPSIYGCMKTTLLPISSVHSLLWQRGSASRPRPMEECLLKGFYRADASRSYALSLEATGASPPDDPAKLERLLSFIGSSTLEWDCDRLRQWRLVAVGSWGAAQDWMPIELYDLDEGVLDVKSPTQPLTGFTVEFEGDCLRVTSDLRNYPWIYCPTEGSPGDLQDD